MVDELLEIVRDLDPRLEPKYNKFYIGLADAGQPNNFVVFKPQKNVVRVEVRVRKSETIEKKVEEAGLDVTDYDTRWGRYRIRLAKGDVKKHREVLREVFEAAHRDNGAADN
jgi:predicted transport protein